VLAPDHAIASLNELLDIFPRLEAQKAPRRPAANQPAPRKDKPVWDAALSTMWSIKNFLQLEDSFLAAGRMGFAGIELNHQINSTHLKGIDLRRYPVTSIHEPCPADISTGTLKARDWLVSATDETCRKQGVAALKKSIDLAAVLGARVVVVHAGFIGDDLPAEKDLVRLYQAGLRHTPEYRGIQEELVSKRAALAEPRLEAVKKSLKELLEYAGRYGVRLGLENRYHIADIPIPGELDQLLELADADRLGFIYDAGHGQALNALGFFPHLQWLERFGGERLFGVHLHDIRGVSDHYAPARGEIDFEELALNFPDAAFRTIEVKPDNSPEQVAAGMELLFRKGCVQCL